VSVLVHLNTWVFNDRAEVVYTGQLVTNNARVLA
jgi:hypothetical protein